MTGRQLYEWLQSQGAADLPIVLHGFAYLGDGEERSTESGLDDSLLDVKPDEVTVWCP